MRRGPLPFCCHLGQFPPPSCAPRGVLLAICRHFAKPTGRLELPTPYLRLPAETQGGPTAWRQSPENPAGASTSGSATHDTGPPMFGSPVRRRHHVRLGPRPRRCQAELHWTRSVPRWGTALSLGRRASPHSGTGEPYLRRSTATGASRNPSTLSRLNLRCRSSPRDGSLFVFQFRSGSERRRHRAFAPTAFDVFGKELVRVFGARVHFPRVHEH
jgi:hypothetical protein